MAVIESIQSELAGRQAEKAAARIEERTDERAANIKMLEEPGGIARANSPARIAARVDRLSKHWARAPRPTKAGEVPMDNPDQVLSTALSRGSAWDGGPEGDPLQNAGDALELIIGTPDFVGINYLETGVAASRAVGRVNVIEGNGQPLGFGTGSLVAPGVLLTNHHVLPDAEMARESTIEFDFEDGPDGQARQSHRVPLAPERLFVADEELDFALVAVDAGSETLAKYGCNPLIGAEGKAVIGEFVTIIQHPRGERKQVALRENRIVDFTEDLVYYDADTEHGSSGSLVFNDQWETVALHHKSAKVSEEVKKGGVVNEGVRISRIVDHLKGLSFEGEAKTLIAPVLSPVTDRPTAPIGAGPEAMTAAEAGGPEGVSIDRDYSSREGYDEDFLGGGMLSVPLPALGDELAAQAATMADTAKSDGKPAHVLPYHHFSVVLSKERKLAFFTAVNIDGATERRLKRDSDSWSLDPRLPADVQTGETVYKDKHLDRGHLVRRLDACWGGSDAIARGGNDDTFHFTNCAPQHEKFNRNATTWAGIEDYILDHADNEDFKVSVFTGPVLADDDKMYRGVKMPRQFWKVVTMAKSPGGLSATAYLLSQEELVDDLKEVAPVAGEEEFAFGAFKTFQVPVSEIEKLTGISFGSLSDHDPLATRDEAAIAPRELVHESSAIL
jgi:endonuclease G, mitochondrial